VRLDIDIATQSIDTRTCILPPNQTEIHFAAGKHPAAGAPAKKCGREILAVMKRSAGEVREGLVMRMQLRVSMFERVENLMEHFETPSQ
jgi:hypothetical protein